MTTTLWEDPEVIRIPDPEFDDLDIELDPELDSEEVTVDDLDYVKLVPKIREQP
ncbi:MAG: hypothetical protein WAM70_15375 [Pyrinomonadaceae bacterium]